MCRFESCQAHWKVGIAQLVRVSPWHGGGPWFESKCRHNKREHTALFFLFCIIYPWFRTEIGGIFVGIAQLAFRFLYEFHFYPHLLTPQASSPYMQGRLKNVRDKQCPSHYPHILGHIHSYRILTWGLEDKKVRETWGRKNIPHMPSALYTSAFERCHVSMWGIFSNSLFFRVRFIE